MLFYTTSSPVSWHGSVCSSACPWAIWSGVVIFWSGELSCRESSSSPWLELVPRADLRRLMPMVWLHLLCCSISLSPCEYSDSSKFGRCLTNSLIYQDLGAYCICGMLMPWFCSQQWITITNNCPLQVASEIGTASLREKTMAFTSTVKYVQYLSSEEVSSGPDKQSIIQRCCGFYSCILCPIPARWHWCQYWLAVRRHQLCCCNLCLLFCTWNQGKWSHQFWLYVHVNSLTTAESISRGMSP